MKLNPHVAPGSNQTQDTFVGGKGSHHKIGQTVISNIFENGLLSRQQIIYLSYLSNLPFLYFPQYIHEEEGVSRPAFSAEAYLKGGALKDGEDKYNRNQFNQAASDAIGADRSVPDTRHSQ